MTVDFDLQIRVEKGWCYLQILADTHDVQIRCHWLTDGLRDLLIGAQRLLDGERSVSVRWPYEIAGGHFIDLVPDPQGGLSIALSEFAHGIESTALEDIWNARRGAVVFHAHVPLRTYTVKVLQSLRRIRVKSVDESGFIPHWGHTFPQATYESFEAAASSRFGYQPTHTAEIVGE